MYRKERSATINNGNLIVVFKNKIIQNKEKKVTLKNKQSGPNI